MIRALTLIVALVALAGQVAEPTPQPANAETHDVPSDASRDVSPEAPRQQTSHCPRTSASKPLLTIWTSRDGTSCRRFWHDLNGDRAFRQAILSRFRLEWRDFDNDRRTGVSRGIVSAPSFVLVDRKIVGYHGRQWLWRQLTTTSRDGAAAPRPLSAATENADPESGVGRPVDAPPPLTPLARRTKPQLPENSPSTSSTLTSSAPPLATLPPTTSAPFAPVRLPPAPTERVASTAIPSQRQPRREQRPVPSRTDRTMSESQRGGLGGWVRRSVPFVLTGLELAGILGGTAATGGLGTIAVAALWRLWRRRRLWKRRRLQQQSPSESFVSQKNERPTEKEASGTTPRAPFPRRLDEARQLLALRRTEGRVATLDALRGMFLDDELAKLAASANETKTALAQQLKTAIDTRVDDVAPLSTVID